MNKELIEKVDDWLTDYGRDCYSQTEDYYQKDTKKAEEIIELCEPKWISVKDRLPEYDLMVLVSCSIYGRYLSSYTQIDNSGFGQWSDHEWNNGALPPTHWQYLPEPPEKTDVSHD